MNTPSKSVYEEALASKEIATKILIPLIEFEFSFHGCEKPSLTQAESNLEQLKTIFNICKKHGWTTAKTVKKLGNKNEYWFKITNKGFKEIYEFSGPMADKNKDKWAKLLQERSEGKEKNRNMKKDLMQILKSKNGSVTTLELSLKTRRLPYTVTRHLRKLEKEGLVEKTESGWIAKR